MVALVNEGWWHPNVRKGQVHEHPARPGRGWSETMHRECERVYTRRPDAGFAAAAAEQIDITNRFGVCATPASLTVIRPVTTLTSVEALVHAAWLVAMADIQHEAHREETGDDAVPVGTMALFAALVERVRNT